MIPPIFSYLCLGLDYHRNYFSKYALDVVQLSENEMKITALCYIDYNKLAYTNIWIESTTNEITKWTLRIDIKFDKEHSRIIFCIVSDDDYKIITPNHAFDDRSATGTDGAEWTEGDIIAIIFDTKNASIGRERKGFDHDLKVIYKEIEAD